MQVRTKIGAKRAIHGLGEFGGEYSDLDDAKVKTFLEKHPGKTLWDFGLEIKGKKPPEPPKPLEPPKEEDS